MRLSTQEAADAARAVLAPALVAGVVAPPNISVLVTDPALGRPLYLCYRSGVLVERARTLGRALAAMVDLVSSYDREELVRVPGLGALRHGRAVVLDAGDAAVPDAVVRDLRRRGWFTTGRTTVDLDPVTGELVVPRPAMAVDTAALAARGGTADAAAPGRYRIRGWVRLGPEPGDDGLSMAGRVAVVAGGAHGLSPATASTVLRSLANALAGAVWLTASPDSLEMVEALVRQ